MATTTFSQNVANLGDLPVEDPLWKSHVLLCCQVENFCFKKIQSYPNLSIRS